MMKFCRTCKYFTDKQGPGVVGTCRRFPPSIMLAGMESITLYPEITPDMRACGEHTHNKRLIRVDNAAGNVHHAE